MPTPLTEGHARSTGLVDVLDRVLDKGLVVAGDITADELRRLAEGAFGGWQQGEPAQPALGTPATTSARLVIVDKPGAPQTQLCVATIGAPRSTPDYPALQVMNMALGGLFSSRINMNLREEHGYTYGAGSAFVYRRAAGPFEGVSGLVSRSIQTSVCPSANTSRLTMTLSGTEHVVSVRRFSRPATSLRTSSRSGGSAGSSAFLASTVFCRLISR